MQVLVAEMQEFPAWFHNLTDTDDKLVENYVTVTRILDAMKVVGFGGFGTAAAKVGGGGIMGAAKAAETGAGARALVMGGVSGAKQAGAKLLTGCLATRAGIFVWVVGQFAYDALSAEQSELRREITGDTRRGDFQQTSTIELSAQKVRRLQDTSTKSDMSERRTFWLLLALSLPTAWMLDRFVQRFVPELFSLVLCLGVCTVFWAIVIAFAYVVERRRRR